MSAIRCRAPLMPRLLAALLLSASVRAPPGCCRALRASVTPAVAAAMADACRFAAAALRDADALLLIMRHDDVAATR